MIDRTFKERSKMQTEGWGREKGKDEERDREKEAESKNTEKKINFHIKL